MIFTDAALEGNDDIATVGAVFLDRFSVMATKQVLFFGEVVPPQVLKSFQRESKKVISTLEVLPVALMMELLGNFLLHRRVFWFIDNDAARASLINGTSTCAATVDVLKKIAMFSAQFPAFHWYSRVPSVSNIADAPSRLDFEHLHSLGATRVHPKFT